MGREEFLAQLREALDGKVSEQIISDNIKYYSSYISSQAADGRSEAEVLAMLGDPRLLAKTIAESSKFASGREQEQGGTVDGEQSVFRKDKIFGWLTAGVMVVALVFVSVIAYRVLLFFAPVLILAAVVYLVYSMTRK